RTVIYTLSLHDALPISQLSYDIDSMKEETKKLRYDIYMNADRSFTYHLKNTIKAPKELIPEAVLEATDSIDPSKKRRLSQEEVRDRKSTRLNSSHVKSS